MTERITSYTHDGLTFDVLDEGPLDGVPAVLLHGFPERGTTWRHVAPILHAQGIRTFAPDQRGYSPGARPRRRRDYRLPLLAADVAALVDRIGRPVHLVGHDWGAVVAWDLVGRHPELVRTLTTASVPHPAGFLRAMVTGSQAAKSWYMAAFQAPGLPELTARRPGGTFDRFLARSGMTTEEVARFRREIVEYGALPGGLAWYRAIPLAALDPFGRRITVPTTLVWSDGDVAVTRHAAELCGRYVDAAYSFEVLEGVSHWIPTQAPEAFARVVLDRIAP